MARKLRDMAAVDQLIRNEGPPHFGRWNAQLVERFHACLAEVDRANTEKLKRLLGIYPWFTVSEFGAGADGDAWLLVQHADHDVRFQRTVLEVLAGLYPKGETLPSHYAYLWDRVAANSGARQRYGTQGRCVESGRWEPFDVEDPAGLDQRRASLGLQPIATYKATFREFGLCP